MNKMLTLLLGAFPHVVLADMAPLSKSQWGDFGGGWIFGNVESCGGFCNVGFYSFIIAVVILSILIFPKKKVIFKRLEPDQISYNVLWCSVISVLVHHWECPGLLLFIFKAAIVANVILILVALIDMIVNRFEIDCCKFFILTLLLLSVLSVTLYESDKKIEIGYNHYLWSRSHCEVCGTALEYYMGRYCPKCCPERRPSDKGLNWFIRAKKKKATDKETGECAADL